MRLDEADREAIARRVVALLREEQLVASAAREMIDATEVARRFGVTADWVRRNARRIGGVRLGDGPRARWRFDAAEVSARVSALSGGMRSEARPNGASPGLEPLRRPRSSSETAGQLPVRSLDLSSLPEKTARRRGNAPGPAPGGTS